MSKVLKIYCKVRDQFCAELKEDSKTLKDYEGYVPDFMPGDHYGDYIELDIDIETGKILNWQKPTESDIQEFINSDEEE